MYSGNLRPNRGSGKIDKEFGAEANYLVSDFKIHHFKWTGGLSLRGLLIITGNMGKYVLKMLSNFP
jgi:hypothetical protein